MAAKKKMGRPPKPKAKRQDRQITVYATVSEYRAIKREAREQGVSLSEVLIRPWRAQGE